VIEVTASTGKGRGGARPGAGRPKKRRPEPSEPTATVIGVAGAVAEGDADIMALSRGLARRVLSDLSQRRVTVGEIDQAASTLKTLAFAARALDEVPAPAEPAPEKLGKKATAARSAAKVSRRGKYSTPKAPRLLIDNSTKPEA